MDKAKERIAGIPFWIVVLGFVTLVIVPVLNTIIYAFSMGWYYPHLLPPRYTVCWFIRTFQVWRLHETLMNTGIIAVLVAIGSISLALPAAYALARLKVPGESFIVSTLIIPLFLPGLAYGIPAARLLYRLHLNNTYLGIALIQMLPITPYVLLMLRGVIAGIPKALEEQAATLGANKFQTLRRVIFPLARPGVAAAAAWAMARSISEFALTSLVAGPRTITLPIVLYSSYDTAGMLPTDNVALAVWLLVPTLAFMSFALRYTKPTTMALKGG
ncbi:MAG: hypothetical protein DRJ45_01225 [Thermoprotei archaeon]|nr:MAG: hypothetical protein DRJ45_01225 [Thermoprotei archaeon]